MLTVGKVDMTPPEPLPLGGYTERKGIPSEGGGEPLSARACLLKQGNQKIAIVSFETLTIPQSLAVEVQSRIGHDIRLLLTATHTHSAPDSQMYNSRMTLAIPGIATYKRKWENWAAERISNLIKELSSGPFEIVSSVYVRSGLYLGNRARRDGAIPDPTVTLVTAQTSMDEVPLWIQFAAHPVFYGPEHNRPSGDWPGTLMRKTSAAFLSGAIGDVSPVAFGASAAEKCNSFTDRLLESVQDSMPVNVWSPADKLRYVSEPIRLAPPSPHPNFATSNKIPESLASNLVRRFAEPSANVEIVAMGSLRLVFVPAEPTAALGRRIQRAAMRNSSDIVLVVSFTNGWIGYTLETEDYKRGGYEAELSFNGSETGDRIVEAVSRAATKLAANRQYASHTR